ncbi:hypothetical protein N8677_01900 [Verrucomicrobia bacterium]|jgi:hypothetical protein|nr:hypothetical protein [Verrucomicrobiota bacterium]MDA7661904.1 hypothetical protein [Verrucomicrobiota bacterium]
MAKFHKARFPKPLGYQGGQISASLFFQSVIGGLSATDQASLIDQLTGKMRDRLRYSSVGNIPISQFRRSVELNLPAIIEGYPAFTLNRSQVTRCVMVPITANNTTAMLMIPITEQFDIYEVF